MTRLEANREILKRLNQEIENHPDVRFHQAMWVIGIYLPKINEYYTESKEVLDRILQFEDTASK